MKKDIEFEIYESGLNIYQNKTISNSNLFAYVVQITQKEINKIEKVVHSTSCKLYQGIAQSGTNSQISTLVKAVLMGSEIPVPWSIIESQRFTIRIELIFR